MKVIVHNKFGDPSEVAKCEDRPVPKPKADEVRLRMKLSPVHNHDYLTVKGEYGYKPELPTIGGTEALGIVDEVGSDVKSLSVGDRVNVAGLAGVWAEFFVAPENRVSAVNKDVPDELAAQMGSMPFSAALALNQLEAESGQWVVVNAANGAVGKTLTQVGQERGLKVAGIVRSKSSRKQLQELGFENVFATSDDDWKDQLLDAVGDGRVAGGVEMVGGEAAGELLRTERTISVEF